MRRVSLLAALLSLSLAASAGAQPVVADPPAGVQVAALPPPDAFTTPGRETGLPADLWKGASLEIVQAVLPKLAERPLSPAAAALARRVLATGAPGPQGAGQNAALLAARGNALLALGEAKSAAAILLRAPGLDRDAELARAAAESALLTGDDAAACAIAEALTVGRDEIYWLRLRSYCQALAGRLDQAQLTFDLAQQQAKDPVFGRLMAAKLAGAGSPGAASLRNGLDYALSRSLGLDLAKPSPTVAMALAGGAGPDLAWTVPPGETPALSAARALALQGSIPADVLTGLLDAAVKAAGPDRALLQAQALIAAAVTGAPGPDLRGRLVALTPPEGRVPAGRNLAMESAAAQHLMGETAMLALWSCTEGALSPGERARIVQALRVVGLAADARNFALEGLLAAP